MLAGRAGWTFNRMTDERLMNEGYEAKNPQVGLPNGVARMMSGSALLHDYEAVARQAPTTDATSIIAYLDQILPKLWQDDYELQTGMPSDLLTVSFGGMAPADPFCRYLFDNASQGAGDQDPPCDDRVVAVWGISRAEPATSRDRTRMRGFLRGIWSVAYPAADRGHFFAHTLGGGLDINLFPQSKAINRSGMWRRMEGYCTRRPGTFCFVHPIYRDATWIPSRLEFGIFKTAEPDPGSFWGEVFDNSVGR